MKSFLYHFLRHLTLVLILGISWQAAAQSENRLVRETEPLSAEDELEKLQVANGFSISLFASEPMINKPINLGFDSRERLWVSSTVEYPYSADKSRWADPTGSRVEGSRDAIKILEDTDNDGTADKVTDFADGLNIPTGVLPWKKKEHHEGCIAWSIPNIWYFADTTGDGRADLREVLFGPLGYEKDTHGMCSSFRMGPDGWVYATHGFNNTSTLRAKDGSEITLKSGNVFRFRPDGSRVELWSGGQVNPFGLTFDGRGNLYSADCHSAPIYQLIQGATYPHFRNPEPEIGFGPAMIQHTHGSTGICGIVYLDRDRWGTPWNDHILIGNPVNSRINSDRIVFTGTTPKAIELPDFVTSEDPWFRPVDLCFGKDGALYVADFYNRIIGHYEVPLDHPGRDRERGRIWKITPTDFTPKPVPPIKMKPPLVDPVASLKAPSPFVRRRAAAQLRNQPQLKALRGLISALRDCPGEDTHLRHVLRLSIREVLRLEDAFSRLDPASAELIRDIIRDVKTQESADFLATRKIRDTKDLTYIARHGGEEAISRTIEKAKQAAGANKVQQANYIKALQTGFQQRGRIEPEPHLLEWATQLAISLLNQSPDAPAWVEISQPGPSPWILQSRKCADQTEATVLSSLRRGEPGAEQRTGTIQSRPFPAPERISFWICGHRGHPNREPHDRNYISLCLDDRELHRAYPPRNDTCQRVTWEIPDPYQGKPVVLKVVDQDAGKSYAWLGITRISIPDLAVESFGNGENDKTLRMLARFLKLTAPVSLRDRLKPWLPKAPPQPIEVSSEQREKLDALIAQRTRGYSTAKTNPTRGEAVFRQHCAACHRIGGEGGLMGPQLDGIGSRGVARLCEDILDPNRNVDVHFRLSRIGLKDKTSLTGFIIAEQGQSIQLRDMASQVHVLSKSNIATRETLAISLMPSTFGATIPESDFYDLVSWLSKDRTNEN